MGQVLYRKYRSRKFSEVIGQDHITKTLEKALKTGRISHAYLFTGPRGVGKTSVARILAREVNNLTYQDDAVHLDIIEIDAASNRRIEEVRDLREKVHIAPTSTKYKVYIIDEVHMLTREAFNALLKTLEEPPAHCIFILATTEAHKLPQTIVSRTQRFSFKPITEADARKHLGSLAEKEKITIEPSALDLLAKHGEGSFRDSISLLDQLSASGAKITEEVVRQTLGLPPLHMVADLASAVRLGQQKPTLALIEDLRSSGANAALVAKNLGTQFREDLITGRSSGSWVANLLKELLEVAASQSPYAVLEIALLQAAANNSSENAIKAAEAQNDHNQGRQVAPSKSQPKPKIKEPGLEQWDEVLLRLKSKAASLYTALRLSNPRIEDGKLVLGFRFPLHQKKVSRAENLLVIEKVFAEVTGSAAKIECVLDQDNAGSDEELPIPPQQNVSQTISNIFGSAEVLET